jgi:hypothetical protein
MAKQNDLGNVKPGSMENMDRYDDFKSPNDQMDFGSPDLSGRKPASKARYIASEFLKGAGEGVYRGMRTELERKMPHTAAAMSEVRQTWDDLVLLRQDFAKAVRPSMNIFKQMTRQALPAVKSFVPTSVYEKLNEALTTTPEPGSQESAAQAEAQRLTDVKAAVNEVFAARSEAEQELQQNKDAREYVNMALDAERHKEMINSLSGIRAATMFQATFLKRDFTAYLKKSLEIKYLHYFTAKDTLSTVQFMSKMLETKLEEIKLNTGLPDYSKITLSERVKDHMWGAGTKRAADYLASFRTKLISNIKANVIGTTEMALSTVAQMLQMMSGFGGDLSGAAAGAVGGIAGEGAGGVLGRKIYDFIRPMTHDLEGWAKGFSTRMKVKFNNYVKGKQYSGGILGFLANLIPTYSGRMSIKNSMFDNPQGPAIFDKAVRMSIVEVMPGYLAKIERHLGGLAMAMGPKGPDGKPIGPEELVYDPKLRDFVTVTQYRKNVHEEAFDRESAQRYTAQAVAKLEVARAQNVGGDKDSMLPLRRIRVYVDRIMQNHAVELLNIQYDILKQFAEDPYFFDNTGYISQIFKGINTEYRKRIAQVLVQTLTKDGAPDARAIATIEEDINTLSGEDKYKEVLPKHTEVFGNRRHLAEVFNRDTKGRMTEGVSSDFIAKKRTANRDERMAFNTRVDSHMAQELAVRMRQTEDWNQFVQMLKTGQKGTDREELVESLKNSFNLKDKQEVAARAIVEMLFRSPEALQKYLERLTKMTASQVKDEYNLRMKSMADQMAEKQRQIRMRQEKETYGEQGVDALDEQFLDQLADEDEAYIPNSEEDATAPHHWRGRIPKFGMGRASARRRWAQYQNAKRKSGRRAYLANRKMIVGDQGDEAVIPVGQLGKLIKDIVKVSIKATELKFADHVKDLSKTAKEILAEIQGGKASAQLAFGDGTTEGTMHYTLKQFADNSAKQSDTTNMHLSEIKELLASQYSGDGKKPRWTKTMAKGLWSKVKNLVMAPFSAAYHTLVKYPAETGYIDVYRKNDMALLLTASEQKVGCWLITGQKVEVTADITCAVQNNDKTKTVITNDDVKIGLVDVYGKPINRMSIRGMLGDVTKRTIVSFGRMVGKTLEMYGRIGYEAAKLGISAITKYPAEEGYVDIYLKGNIIPGSPLLSADRQEKGVFFANGERVKISADIIEPVFDATKATALISIEHIKHGLVDQYGTPISRKSVRTWVEKAIIGIGKAAGTTLGTAGRLAWDATKGTANLVANVLGGGVNALAKTPAEEGYIDVYRKDEVDVANPLLSVRQQELGVYLFTKKTQVQVTADINEAVVDAHGRLLITKADVEHGLVDKDNRPIVPLSRRIGKTIGSTALGVMKLGGRAIGGMVDIVKTMIEKGPLALMMGAMKTGWKGLKWGFEKGKDVFDSLWNITVNKNKYKPITDRLDTIIDYLKYFHKYIQTQMPVAGDTDNNRFVENTYQDAMADKKAKASGYQVYKTRRFGGLVPGMGGVLPMDPNDPNYRPGPGQSPAPGTFWDSETGHWVKYGGITGGVLGTAGAAWRYGKGAYNIARHPVQTYEAIAARAKSAANATEDAYNATKRFTLGSKYNVMTQAGERIEAQPNLIRRMYAAIKNVRFLEKIKKIPGPWWVKVAVGLGVASTAFWAFRNDPPPPELEGIENADYRPEDHTARNAALGIGGLAALGGAGYLGYKKFKGAATVANTAAQTGRFSKLMNFMGLGRGAAASGVGGTLLRALGAPLSALLIANSMRKTATSSDRDFNAAMEGDAEDNDAMFHWRGFKKTGGAWLNAIPVIGDNSQIGRRAMGFWRTKFQAENIENDRLDMADIQQGRAELANKIYQENLAKGMDPKAARQNANSRAMKEYKHTYKTRWSVAKGLRHPWEGTKALSGWAAESMATGAKATGRYIKDVAQGGVELLKDTDTYKTIMPYVKQGWDMVVNGLTTAMTVVKSVTEYISEGAKQVGNMLMEGAKKGIDILANTSIGKSIIGAGKSAANAYEATTDSLAEGMDSVRQWWEGPASSWNLVGRNREADAANEEADQKLVYATIYKFEKTKWKSDYQKRRADGIVANLRKTKSVAVARIANAQYAELMNMTDAQIEAATKANTERGLQAIDDKTKLAEAARLRNEQAAASAPPTHEQLKSSYDAYQQQVMEIDARNRIRVEEEMDKSPLIRQTPESPQGPRRATPVDDLGAPRERQDGRSSIASVTDAVNANSTAVAKALNDGTTKSVGALGDVKSSVDGLHPTLQTMAANTAALPDLAASIKQLAAALAKQQAEAKPLVLMHGDPRRDPTKLSIRGSMLDLSRASY